jgi:hypothetical protein
MGKPFTMLDHRTAPHLLKGFMPKAADDAGNDRAALSSGYLLPKLVLRKGYNCDTPENLAKAAFCDPDELMDAIDVANVVRRSVSGFLFEITTVLSEHVKYHQGRMKEYEAAGDHYMAHVYMAKRDALWQFSESLYEVANRIDEPAMFVDMDDPWFHMSAG